ncbi:MAG: endo-1,4-beta-xylanase [Actinobacteria bacterium]|nr:endo-1,4-beta-xylanase [Actinomycetota bacterium]
MRRRSFLAAGGAAGLATTLGGLGTVVPAAGAATAAADNGGQSDALRTLAAKVGLRIGTAVTPFDLTDKPHTDILASQFSAVTPENEMKWQVVEPTQGVFNWTGADNLVNFAQQNKQLVRGHTLLWHNQLPNWLTTGVATGTISNSQLMDLLEAHIFTEVGRYRGQIWQWDVANEFFTDSNPQINPNDFWISHLGTGIIAQAFRWARQADPHALLFYNDYNIAGEDGSNAKFKAAHDFIQGMLDQGVPIDGVGNQGHLDTQFGFPTSMQQDLEAYASLGLKVAITEADVRTFVTDPTTQTPTTHLATFAQPYEYDQMMKAALAVPEVISFTVWGFSDDESWVPGTFKGEGYADIYDVNLTPKPAYFALQQDLRLAAFAAPEHGTS